MKHNYIVLLMATALTGSYQQLLTRPEEDPISASYQNTIASGPQINDAIKATIPKTIATTSASHPNTIAPTPQIDDPIKAGTPPTSSVASTRKKPQLTIVPTLPDKHIGYYNPRYNDIPVPLNPDRLDFKSTSDYKKGHLHDKSITEINQIAKEAFVAPLTRTSHFLNITAMTQVLAEKYALNLSERAHLESLLRMVYTKAIGDNTEMEMQEVVNFLNNRVKPYGIYANIKDVKEYIKDAIKYDDEEDFSGPWNRLKIRLGHAYNAIMPGKSLGATLKPIHTEGEAEMEAEKKTDIEEAQIRAQAVAQIKAQAKAQAQIKAQPNPSISDKYPMSPYGMTQSQLLPGDQKTQQPSGFKTSN